MRVCVCAEEAGACCTTKPFLFRARHTPVTVQLCGGGERCVECVSRMCGVSSFTDGGGLCTHPVRGREGTNAVCLRAVPGPFRLA